ncbi:Fe-S cluster assembly protein SufD [Microbacter margulisiae]|uniref:Fe-S cluster assembly protein SufD n=2 Tax=Microbacter margulisiae TaxID=1350067 RepID=A0A7W5DQU6_9PORP|nr:Fe-S cluster assembly protein SufD [Microbacter margulisiae]
MMSKENTYIELYQQYRNAIHKPCAPLLNAPRDEAMDAFIRLGFPTTSQEDYMYTDLASAFEVEYGLNINRLSIPSNPGDVFRCDVPGITSWVYFVVNDSFYRMPRQPKLPEEVIVCSLNEAAEKYPALFEKYYNRLAPNDEVASVAFNTAFAQDGFFMYVPDGVTLEKPVQLVDIMRSDVDFMANSRNLIIIGEGAKARFLECAHTVDNVQFLSNRVTEVFVGENATFDYYSLENTHNKTTNIASLYLRQEASSNVVVNEIVLHNGMTRNDVKIDLQGEKCQTLLCGMAIGDKAEHIDNSTLLVHAKPGCQSRELYKYVLDDSSVGAFAGKILVAEGAQKTEALLTNRNLCVTPTARMKTKPQLEIYADDVKCSHGATIGQLDETAMFYMRSRGLSEADAKLLLMYAFMADVIDNIRIDVLQERIRYLVEKRFRGELSKCTGCVVCK